MYIIYKIMAFFLHTVNPDEIRDPVSYCRQKGTRYIGEEIASKYGWLEMHLLALSNERDL